MKEIIHLADLHIRCGLSDKSRYLEYHNVFTNIVNDLATYPAVVAKNAVIVIAGDIFHHKLTIHSPGIKLFLEFASRLASLAHVYVIRGNHDYRQDIPDEPALISALLGIGIPGVSYIDNTCTVLVDDDIGFGICAIQNTLHRGNTSGICSELPPFPDPSEFPANIKKKIAIFHGSVASSNEHTQSTYPISWFNGYDAVILGDIHVQQVHNGFEIRGKEEESTFENSVLVKKYKCDSGAMPWAYSGSVLQQNFGEHLMGHGFIIWDLDNEIIKCYHCVNKYGFVTVKYTDECSQWMVSGSSWTILDDVIDKPWFPTNIMLRIVENDNQAYFKLAAIVSKIFAAHHKIVVDIKHHCGKDNDINLDVVDVTVADTVDITSFNNPTTWIEFLTKCGVPGRDEWRCWMTDPDDLYMLEPEDDLDLGPVIEKNIKDRDEKFSKEIWAYISRYDLLHNVVQAKHCFTINNLKWNWILCYKDNCFFDFDSMTKSIYAIVARNGNGKTSFLETICIALFGEGFPSRTTKNSDTSIICAEKPMSSKANTSITVTVNNKTFCINREFKQKDGKLVPQTRTTNISEGISEIHSGKTAVGDWVKQNIGDINAFLLSCMVSQNNDMDFFSLKSVDQQSLLDTALCINSATEFKSLLDSAHLNHKKILADLNAKCATLSRVLVTPDFDQDYIVSVKKDILRYTSENQLFMSAHNVLLKKVGNNDGILDSCSKELIGEYIKRFSRVVNTTFLDDSDLGKLTGMYEYALCNYASCQQFSGKGSGMSLDDLIDKRNALVQPGKTFEFIKKRLAELKWHYGDIDNSIDGIDLDVKKDMLTALLKNKPRLPRFSTKEHISWNKKMSVILHKYKSVDEVVGQLNKITIIDPPDVSHQVAKYQLSSLGTHEGTGQSEEELLLHSDK